MTDRDTESPAPAKSITIKWVRHEQAAEYEALGWRNTGPLPGPHGNWSVGMEWPHDSDPVYPERERQPS